ncbi:hypothetical protein JKA74_09735 [Marivirga sp. S37H4]|uniref:3-hydroxyacyl-ACP dehydratase n=1 Tax=Marivirga aurantiaca TaxID=2802615 RepID=A0A934WYV4_9BACT|nr:hypothetical protein [Marivirga aurantiaca]MBK6265321.1 hypothetical protein [Marivirga aurantiaca]
MPHAEPFVMIDEMLSVEQNKAVSSFKISENNLMLDRQELNEGGLVENIAQTFAVKAGFQNISRGLAPQVGYVAMIKKLKVYSLVPVGETIITEIIVKTEKPTFVIGEGVTYWKDIIIVSCELMIFINDEKSSDEE